jgi:hypothetical protein
MAATATGRMNIQSLLISPLEELGRRAKMDARARRLPTTAMRTARLSSRTRSCSVTSVPSARRAPDASVVGTSEALK